MRLHDPKQTYTPAGAVLLGSVLLTCLSVSPHAHSDYDFSNPAYVVHNVSERPSDNDTDANRDIQQAKLALARQQRAAAQHAEDQYNDRIQPEYEWFVITSDGQKIPYDDYVRDHAEFNHRGNGYIGDNGARVSSGSGRNNSVGTTPSNRIDDIPGITPLNAPPRTTPTSGGSILLRLFSILFAVGSVGYLFYVRMFKVPNSNRRLGPTDKPANFDAALARAGRIRPSHHPAAQQSDQNRT